ncbi:DUF6491 family protein [Thalassotalea sp. ND16A]|uniref:DUF6491 family protein n=1 Tax=Thalassotalea sp. ND16A TaxID=1535422 RepID=UPI00051A406E|nr:DUF6491 family protein [Thalassotalea sp. ND16A]KGJ89235.1 hypothetical protein ND16A_2128 [Thalassotalea sp. ND16A]
MFKTKRVIFFAVALLSACAATEQAKEEKTPDIRQGEAVNQICFNRNMDGWRPLEDDNKALIVFDRRRQAYKLDLIGTCDPQWAMMRIATISRGSSSCLSRGDKVITDADMSRHDSCTIMKIYKWHPEKLNDEGTQKTAATGEEDSKRDGR